MPGPGSGGREMNFTATNRDPPAEEPGGGRPGSVTDPAPQGQVLRHTGEHVDEICPSVPILDVPVLQMGYQVVEVLQKFDVPSVEQVIAVPRISFDQVPPQRAEQLVQVPTEPGHALAVVASKVFSTRELRGFLSG